MNKYDYDVMTEYLEWMNGMRPHQGRHTAEVSSQVSTLTVSKVRDL